MMIFDGLGMAKEDVIRLDFCGDPNSYIKSGPSTILFGEEIWRTQILRTVFPQAVNRF